jgi:hypothetical protein
MAENRKTSPCIVPGCPNEGRNRLGVRDRIGHDGETPFPEKSRTYALFSIDAGHLCDEHSLNGVELQLSVRPTATREATLVVRSGDNVEERTKPIRQPVAA